MIPRVLRSRARLPSNCCRRYRRGCVFSTTVFPPTETECRGLGESIQTVGFAVISQPILSQSVVKKLADDCFPRLFRGEFETGVYPDEWHWRQGLSLPTVTREICNAYKSDRTVASVILSQAMGAMVCDVMGWSSVRIGQDDVIWKPPAVASVSRSSSASSTSAADDDNNDGTLFENKTVVGFHQDSAYISVQFDPYENNSVTVWMALDDATHETGCLEYAPGSHKWSRRTRGQRDDEDNLGSGTFHSVNADTYQVSLPIPPPPQHQQEEEAGGTSSSSLSSTPTIVAVECPARHAILHHQDVWHGSGSNRSTTHHRRALVGHYIRGDVQWRSSSGLTTTTAMTSSNNSISLIPWGTTSYIYGRYRRTGVLVLDESFFPILHAVPGSGQERSPWVDEYIQVTSQ